MHRQEEEEEPLAPTREASLRGSHCSSWPIRGMHTRSVVQETLPKQTVGRLQGGPASVYDMIS